MIVPYAAGGTGDVVARVVGQAITQKTGQSIVVEDRPGASSIVGTEFVSRATPDGTTVLLVENPFILSSILFPGHYDPVSNFEPLCYIAATPAVLAVSSKSDIQNLADFLKLAQTKAGAVSYGSTGPASIVHIAGELLKRDAKVDMTYVPYPGSPPAMNATLAGTITAVIANYSDLKGQIDSRRAAADCCAREKTRCAASQCPNFGRERLQRSRRGRVVRFCCSGEDSERRARPAFSIHFRCCCNGRCRRKAQRSGDVHQSLLRRRIREIPGRAERHIYKIHT